MSFLVIGNWVKETVVREEDGATRTHTGGVGAIMARELALAGAEVTFLTTAPEGHIEETRKSLHPSITPIVLPGHPPQSHAAAVTITTRNGNPQKYQGNWAQMGQIAPHIEKLVPQHDWTLISLNLKKHDLETLFYSKSKVAVNATTTNLVKKVPLIPYQAIYTMNQREATTLAKELGIHAHEDVRDAIGAKALMLTRGRSGRSLYRENHPDHHWPAIPAPPGTDFIGAGDAATAGLVYATAMDLDPGKTVDTFIASLLASNAQAYAKPQLTKAH